MGDRHLIFKYNERLIRDRATLALAHNDVHDDVSSNDAQESIHDVISDVAHDKSIHDVTRDAAHETQTMNGHGHQLSSSGSYNLIARFIVSIELYKMCDH